MEPLSVPGTLESLKAVGEYAVAAAEEAGLTKSAAYKLRLAVDEVVTNIIHHGYGQSGTVGPVELTAEIRDDALHLTVEDTGPPFDPFTILPPADLDKPLEERDMGGLGVYLAIDSVDELKYQYVDNRNRNTFIMRLPAKEGES